MLNRNKIENYIKAAEKIKIPIVKGEGYIICKEKKVKKKVFNKLALVAACACLFLVGNFFMGTQRNLSGSSTNLFTIVAASANENDEVVTLEKGAIKELLGGRIALETGDSAPVGFTIKGSNIKSIDLSCSTGYFQVGYVKIEIDDEAFKEAEKNEHILTGDGIDIASIDSIIGDIADSRKNYVERFGRTMWVAGTDGALEYGISWFPKEAIDGVEAGVTNLSDLKGDEILVKVTFNDETTGEAIIETTYNEKGEILATLK